MNRPLLIAALTLALAACRENAAQAPADAGVTPPARTLVTGHLLGDTPIDNRVHIPHFDLSSELWYAYSFNSMIEMRRLSLAQTPTDLPVLQVLESSGQRTIIGTLRGGPSLTASVWIGRDYDDSDNYEDPQVMVYGLTPTSGSDGAFELVVEPGSDKLIDNGNGLKIRWQRYSGVLAEEVLGLGSFVFQDSGTGNLYINAPVVTSSPVGGTALRAMPATARAVRREPTLAEKSAVARAMAAIRDRPPRRLPDAADGLAPSARSGLGR